MEINPQSPQSWLTSFGRSEIWQNSLKFSGLSAKFRLHLLKFSSYQIMEISLFYQNNAVGSKFTWLRGHWASSGANLCSVRDLRHLLLDLYHFTVPISPSCIIHCSRIMITDSCCPALFASSLPAIRLCSVLLISFSLWRFSMHPSYPLFFGTASLIALILLLP
jgi:hypothetical protein